MKTAVIGGGNMGGAIIAGMAGSGVPGPDILLSDPSVEKRAVLASKFGVIGHEGPGEWLGEAELVLFAVKPQVFEACARAAAPFIRRDAFILTIAAGVKIEAVRRWTGLASIVRAMPNMPAKVGLGLTGLYAPDGTPQAARHAAESVMKSVGRVVWLAGEDLLHTVTGGPGSGPAYVYLFMESLASALAKRGLTAAEAREFALSTVEGAAALARQSGDDFADLRRSVTSKGGTTAEALAVFEARDLRGIVDEAVAACITRSREMGELYR